MTELEVGFPSQIKKLRDHLHLSQEDLARELGVSFSTVNRWENGKTKPIKVARSQFDFFCTRMIRQGKLDKEFMKQSAK
jgi:DNA-binding XRE family transcriptional regulator